MEIIGLILLFVVTAVVCYFLDLYETIWTHISRVFVEFKKWYANTKRNHFIKKRNHFIKKAERVQAVVAKAKKKEIAHEARDRAKIALEQWKERRKQEADWHKPKVPKDGTDTIDSVYNPQSMSEDFFFAQRAIGTPKLTTLAFTTEEYAKAKVIKSSGMSITAVRTKDGYTDDPGPG